LTPQETEAIKGLMLLTSKPVIYAANVADTDLATGNEMSRKVQELAKIEGSKTVLVSAQVESELSGLNNEDRAEFLATLGVTDEQCGLKVRKLR
jgi:ribosome-binding ATPase YchF (GTP1/OBG family)